MSENEDFWRALDTLVGTSETVIDRPRGTAHPRYADFIYPLDYGYLQGTSSGDGDGIDVWIGSLVGKHVTALICTVDLKKRDAEIKLLLGCTAGEQRVILAIHQKSAWGGSQSALLMERPVRVQPVGEPADFR